MKTRNIAFTMVPLLLSCFALSLIARADLPLPVTQVIGGLLSPRGLAFGPGGQLFVAQTGDDTVNGSIIEILNPMDSRPLVRSLVSGLPNVGEEGEFVGVDGISIL